MTLRSVISRAHHTTCARGLDVPWKLVTTMLITLALAIVDVCDAVID